MRLFTATGALVGVPTDSEADSGPCLVRRIDGSVKQRQRSTVKLSQTDRWISEAETKKHREATCAVGTPNHRSFFNSTASAASESAINCDTIMPITPPGPEF